MSWELTGNSDTNPATNFLGTTDNQPLAIKTNGTEHLRVDENGNVGIGTRQPGRLLALEGGPEVALRLRDKSVPTDAFWELQPSAFLSDHFGILRYEGGAAQASKSLVITPNGNVGIGTTTLHPGYALHVNAGNIKSGVLAVSDTGSGLTAVTHSPDFFALAAENRQGSAFVAAGAETGQFSTGIQASGFTAVRGESQNGTAILGITHSQQFPNVSGVGVIGQCRGQQPGAGVIGQSEFGTGVIAFGGTQGDSGGGDGLHAGTGFGWCGKFIGGDPRGKG